MPPSITPSTNSKSSPKTRTILFTLSNLPIDLGNGVKNTFTIYFPIELGQGVGKVTCYSRNQVTTTLTELPDCEAGKENGRVVFRVTTNRESIPDGQYEWIRVGPIQNPPSEDQGTNFDFCIAEFHGQRICISKSISYYPNIMGVTVTQTSYLVSDITDLELSVNLANDVPADGSIEIKLPLGYPTTTDYIEIDLKKGQGKQTILNCITNNGHTITILCSRLSSGLSANDPDFSVYIFGVTNPSTVMREQGIDVSTKLSNGLRVNKNDPPASIVATTPSTITFLTLPLTQTNTIVGSNFGITITMILPRCYESGGAIHVYLPKAVVPTESVSCIFGKGWESFASGKCTPKFEDDTYCIVGTVAYPSTNRVELTISNLLMPEEVRTLEPIYVVTQGINKNVISKSDPGEPKMILSLRPGVITGLSLVRDSSNVVNAETQVTIKFTVPGLFMRTSRIHLNLPKEQIFSAINIIAGTTCNCELHSQDSMFTTIECYPSSQSGWCSTSKCPANTLITLTIDGLKNPAISYPYQLSAKVSVYNYDPPNSKILYLAHETTSKFYFPPLLPNPINEFTFSITGSRLTGAATEYALSFTTVSELPIGCIVYLTFPDDFAYSSVGNSIEVEGFVSVVDYYSSGAIKHINITNVCLTKRNAKESFSWKILNVKNAPHTVPVDYKGIMITTETNDYGMFDKGLNVNQDILLQPNTLITPLINLATPILAGNLQSASIEFTLKNKISKSNGFFEIKLPIETSIEVKGSNPITCQVKFNSITGPCNVKDLHTISVELAIFSGLTTTHLSEGTKVDVSFTYLRTPRIVKPSSYFTIQSYLKVSGTNYCIDKCDQCGMIIPTQANTLIDASVIRNETLINIPVYLDVQFTTYNPIPVTGSVVLEIPIEGAIIGDNGIDSVMAKSVEDIAIKITTVGNIIRIVLPQFCNAINGCEANKRIRFTVTGLKNPPTAIATNFYFKIYTRDKQEEVWYDIDTSGNILATPQICAGQLSDVVITRGLSDTLASPISYTISFTLVNSISDDKGQISILPFTETMMAKDQSNTHPKCSMLLNNVFTNIDCTAVFNCIDTLGFCEITMVTMSLECPDNLCPIGLTRKIIIEEVQSSFRTSGQGSFVIKTINTKTNGIVDAATTEPLALTTLHPLLFEISSARRSHTIVDSSTELLLSITTGLNYEAGSTISAKIYVEEFVFLNNLACSTLVNEGNYVTIPCSKLEQSDDYVVIIISDPCSGTNLYCTKGSKIDINIAGFINGHSVSKKDSKRYLELELHSESSGILLQRSNAENFIIIPVLIPATIRDISVIFGEVIVGAITELDLTFILDTDLLISDIISLSMDSKLLYKTTTTKCYVFIQGIENEVQCSFELSSQDNHITKITFAPEIILHLKNIQIHLRLRNVRNVPYVSPYLGLLNSIITDKNGNLVAKGNLDLSTIATVESALFSSISLQRINTELNTITDLKLSLILSTTLPANSYISITIPTDQMMYTGTIKCTPQCTLITTTEVITFDIRNICPSGCSEQSKLEVVIVGFKNPSDCYVDSVPVTVTSHINTGEIVHSAVELQVTPSLNIPKIEISELTSKQLYTNQITDYSFYIRIPNNVPPGGQLIITIPSNIMLKDTSPKCALYDIEKDCTFQYSGSSLTKVIFNDIFISGGEAKKDYYISIQNVKNPVSTIPLLGLMVVSSTLITDSRLAANQGYFDFASITLLPAPILVSSVKRTSTILGAVNTLEFSFITRNPIPITGKIELILPSEYGGLQDTTQCFNEDKQIPCSFSINKEQNPSWTISFSQFCDPMRGCLSGESISIVLTNIVNPITLIGNNCVKSIQIITYTTKHYSIDAVTSGLCVTPLLNGEELKVDQLGIVLEVAGTTTTMFLQFMPNANMPSTQKLIIDFSRIQFAGTVCYNNSYTQDTKSKKCSTNLNVVTLEDLCNPNGCTNNQQLTLNFPFINAPYSNTILGDLGIYARTIEGKDSAYGKISLNIEIIPHKLSEVSLRDISCNTTGTLCNYFNMDFKLYNEIPSYRSNKGQVKVDMGTEFGFSATTCTALIVGSQKLQCSINSYFITIFDNLSIIPSNSKIQLNILNIQLPFTTKPLNIFIESLREVSGTMATIDADYELTYAVPNPLPFPLNSIIVTRSESLINTAATYNLNIPLDISLPKDSYIIIDVPKDASLVLISENDCTVNLGSGKDTGCVITSTTGKSTIKILCEDTNCGNENIVSITIPGTLVKNQGYVNEKPKSMKIYTSFDGMYFAQTNIDDIIITPKLVPMQLTVEASRDYNYLSYSIALTVKTKLELPNESGMFVEIPDKLFAQNFSPLYCSVAKTSVKCSDDGNSYIRTIRIYNLCPTFCNTDIEVTIEGLRNSDGNYNIPSSAITISSITAEGHKIAEGNTGSFSSLSSIEMQRIVIEPTESTSSVLILIYSPVLLVSTASLKIVLPTDAITLSSLTITPFLATQDNPQLRKSSNTIIINNLFSDGVQGRGGAIYGFYLNNFLKGQSVISKFEVYSQNSDLITYKNDVELNVGVKASSCGDSAPNLQSGNCVDECSLGYFHYKRHCIKCFDLNCERCENHLQYSCSACNDSSYITNGFCTSSCSADLTSITSDNAKTSHCARDKGCSSECSTAKSSCSSSGNYCFKCTSDFSLVSGLGQCLAQCPDGYYKDTSSMCVKCHYSCNLCNASGCTKCSELYDRFLDMSEGKCIASCPEQTYTNKKNQVCEPCAEECGKCNGTTSNDCISCVSPYFLKDSACVKECPDGYKGNEELHECVISSKVKDIWLITVILSCVVIVAIAICKGLFLLKVITIPVNILEISCALFTAIETINKVIILSDLWAIKSTWLFTFICANLLLNSILMLLFHAQFFGTFLRTEGTPKNGSILVSIITLLSLFLGFGFIRILTSGFFTSLLLQPFKKSAEYNAEVDGMGNYAMISNIGQVILYGCCYAVHIIGLSTIGIILGVLLVGIHIWELVTEYAKYQFILNAKNQ